MDGQVRPAKVGLILSSVDDVLTGANNSSLALHNNERKAIYYALRHAQVPVDFLSEDDVIEGRAKDCQVIYILQQWMHSKATAALTKWVQAGGTLVALGGVVVGHLEVRLLHEEQVGGVAQAHEAIQVGIGESVRAAQLVAEQARGLAEIVDELRLLGGGFGRMVVDHQPVRPVHACLEGKVAHPGGALAQDSLFPSVVMMRLQPHIRVKECSRQPLQEQA